MQTKSLIFKTTLTMIAFAANSILCRLALKDGHIDPLTFSNLRLLSGAIVLSPLLFQNGLFNTTQWNLKNSFFLMIYAVFFSVAYVHLDASLGALLLFGVVQITMILHGLFRGEPLTLIRKIGLILAIFGMVLLLLPGAETPPFLSAILMGISGFAWAVYSISGKKISHATLSTAGNFILAVPMALILSYIIGDWNALFFDTTGLVLAMISGAVASAGAYTLWYSLLPQFESITASTIQLSVPCLAMFGGIFFLGESLSLRIVFASIAVFAGILLVIRAHKS